MPATTPSSSRLVPGCVERAEAQRVQQRDRPRAHREDVADDAADAGRRALIRFDERRVIVRFDLEDRGEPVADVDRAGVLARPLQHLRPFGRQRPQVHARALVAAVLGPHHREDAELGQVRLAPEEGDDALVLVRLEAVAFENLGVDHDAGDPVERRIRGVAGLRRRPPPPAAPRRHARQHRFENHQAVDAAEQPLRRRARGAASCRRRCAASLQSPAIACSRSVRIRTRRRRGPRVECSGGPPDGSLRSVRACPAAQSSCPRRGRSESAAPDRSGRCRLNGVSVCSTRTWTCSQRYFSPRLRSIAPGSSPASSRTWKPLQMPSTGPPRSANARIARHDRREARHRAGAQVVAVGEAARQDHDVGALQDRCPCAR